MLTVVDGGLLSPTNAQYTGFKNKIINGQMQIDQRNAGASVSITTSNPYTLDRWGTYASQSNKFTVQQNAGSVTPPAGFTNYLGVTSSAATSLGATDYYIVRQTIEGFNSADLSWGTADAKTVTLSFWVRSSLTGVFSVCLTNVTNGWYTTTYTINSANTWQYVTITIPGTAIGTWLTTNGIGIEVRFNLGIGSTYTGAANTWTSSVISNATGSINFVGTSGATFYITGVQLEKGSTATSFDYRPYGTELALCQRYFTAIAINDYVAAGFANTTTSARACGIYYPVTLRANPTITLPTAGQGANQISFTKNDGSYPSTTGTNTVPYSTTSMFVVGGTGYTGLVASANAQLYSNGASTIQVSAEL